MCAFSRSQKNKFQQGLQALSFKKVNFTALLLFCAALTFKAALADNGAILPKPVQPGAAPYIEQEDDLRLYPLQEMAFSYARPHPDHIPGRVIEKTELELVKTPWGYAGREEGFTGPKHVSFDDIEARGRIYITAGALQAIIKATVESLSEAGLMGVYVIPHPGDINPYGEDLRQPGNSELRFMIYTAQVAKVLSKARGPRFLNDKPLNHDAHEWIRQNSPVKPASEDENYDDLLNKKIIGAYMARLNRHPGRHVSMTVGGAQEEGKAVLEYHITESKPWIAYMQFSDTGTGNTAPWQKRVGLIHNQISGHDDILSLDYTTASFDDFNALQLSYDAPWRWQKLNNVRLGMEAGFSEFTSTDVGLPGADFTGRNLSLGLNLTYLVFQKDDWFLDLTGGVQWKRIEVDNELAQVKGDEKFFKPRLGLALERKTRLSNTSAAVSIETNMAGLAGTDSGDLPGLGRTRTDARWAVLQGAVRHSFFLEPLIYGEAFRDPSTPESSTMAHEVRLNARGQFVPGDDRLVPQEKFVAGGLYSVRGYPQSVVSGDSGIVGSVEYRFHLPRALPFNPDPKATLFGDVFRMVPTQVFGYPDWDLVLKLFSDAGHTFNNDNIAGIEENETFWGLGAGIELQVRKNFRLQLDFGRAMLDLESGRVSRGDNELHAEVTFFY